MGMRLVLYNPHADIHLGDTVLDFFAGKKSFKKYGNILKFLIDYKKPFVIYTNNLDSSFPRYISKYIPKNLEIYLWMFINKLNPFRVTIVSNVNYLNSNDVFLGFALKTLDTNDLLVPNFRNKKFIKIFHLSHYVAKTSLIAKNIDTLRIDFLIAENNLRKNSKYFRKTFPKFTKDIYVLPFVFQDRFSSIVPFNKRKNKCLATGTLIHLKEFPNANDQYEDFFKFSKSGILQPGREEILLYKKELKPYIDSYIANFWETKRKEWSERENILNRWKKRVYNALFATKRNYMKFNIVEKYNSYKMFVVPEEAIDLPGIGFVEGMACGCAYIGRVDPMYTDLGLKPGIHYIGYDGSIKDLKKKIGYYQSHPKQLEEIAQRGYEYVRNNFNGETVANKFWKDLENLVAEYKKNKYNSGKLVFKASYR